MAQPVQQPPVVLSNWDTVKAFFKYSLSILNARCTALAGLVTAAVGMLDWSPLLGLNFDTGFSQKQVFWTGAVVFVKGLIDEVSRRRTLP